MEHKLVPPGERHQAHNWEYATAAARVAATSFTTDQLNGLALQLSDGTYWRLTSFSPVTWMQSAGPLPVQLRYRVTLDGAGAAVIAYGQSFANRPSILATPCNVSGKPVFVDATDTGGVGAWTGCTLRASRGQILPALLASLFGFDPFAASAAGVEVSVLITQV